MPLARWSCPELARHAVADGICASISPTTIRRWLSQDALKPWQQQSWIFISDPNFADKASRALDLYARVWDGKPLSGKDGSSHRGQAAIDRLAVQFPNAIMVHTPVHASWLNQVEIFFSVVQRKVFSPNDFTDTDHVAARLAAFETSYTHAAEPFKWKFATTHLADLPAELNRHELDHDQPDEPAA